MDDAQLVVAARAGDRNAYAAIYDRYADRIHDFCASMLRNRADAADALHETFSVAFEAIDDLAEPARLRSWLYALAHRSVRDSVARRGTPLLADDTDLVVLAGTAGEPLSRAELAEFIWQASGGLDLADRVLLDLHQRQGLDGRDLAGAAGVPASQLDARVARLEAQAERSLGALLVARTGRRTCPDLSAILSHIDELPPDFRERVTAHVDDCERCNSRRRIAPSALGLLVATPLTPAPAYLRGVVLGHAELSALRREGELGGGALAASVGWAFNREGFPELAASGGGSRLGGEPRPAPPPAGPVFASTRPTTAIPMAGGDGGGGGTATTYLPRFEPSPGPPRHDDHDRRGMVIGALAGLIILIAGVVILVSHRGRGPSGAVAVRSSTTVAAEPTTTTTPTTLPVVVPTTLPTTTALPRGHITVGTKTLDLGVAATTGSVQIGNDGAAAADFTATPSGTGLTVIPAVGNLSAGNSQTLAVTLDRTAAPPGPFSGSITITSPAGNVAIAVTGTIDPGPVINGELATPAFVSASTCPGHATSTTPTTATITATVTSTEALKIVVLHWHSPPAGTVPSPEQTTTMTMGAAGYSAKLPAFDRAGSVDWWITAVDIAYVTSTSGHHPLTVACP